MTKKQYREKFLKKIENKYMNGNGDNIYPKSMSDEEFRKLIIDYFLGDDYYIADPISHGQANVIVVYEIISKN